MPGIYIHIPFCRQACHYCDFHFSTSHRNKNEFLEALLTEMELRKDYLGTRELSTIYLGGGTPSVLTKEELAGIFAGLSGYFTIRKDAEITLEANPDDLSKEFLGSIAQTPVNRLSIGIQSFSDQDLKFLNRIHDAGSAVECIKNAQRSGFSNITIDLIYGIQTLTDEQWKENLYKAFQLDVPHISCYALTVEPRTALESFIRKGRIPAADTERSAAQFEILMDEMERHGYLQYEISNFCRDNMYSRHNSGYWKGEKYLGIGPSAHSFNGISRQWNVRSNAEYISSLQKAHIPNESERLTEIQMYNEYILTSLRTVWGVERSQIRNRFSSRVYDHFDASVARPLAEGYIEQNNGLLTLSKKGKLFADRIASDLFLV